MSSLTVPLPIETLHQVIEDNEKTYLINYKDSKIKGKPFIFYLSNLNVSTQIEVENLDKEELSSLLSTYMEINTLFKCEELNVLVMVALLHFMGLDTDDILAFELPEGFLDEFVAEHQAIISRYYVFCSSMLKYCDYIEDLAAERDHALDDYEGVIDDPKFVGVNIVWLFEIPSFFELFFSARKPEDYIQYYFPIHFEEYLFNGKNLYYFFIGTEDNPNWLLLNKMALERFDGLEHNTLGGDSGSEEGTE